MTTHIHKIFSTPLLQFKFDQHSKYVFDNVPKQVKKPNDWVEPLNTSFPEIPDHDNLVDRFTKDNLKTDLLNSISSALQDIDLPNNIKFLNLWYNIYHDNQGQEAHWHLPASGRTMPYWSGIYYNRNTNPTIFHRDHGVHRTHECPRVSESKIRECWWNEYYPDVVDGDILLFPPYLLHSVKSEQHHQHNMRLTFSFNLILQD